MEQELRHTGLDIVGDAPWGTHFCQFYQTKEDLIDILVPYFKAGLENNEFCMWVTAEPLSAEDALLSLRQAVPNVDDYLERGQLEVLPHDNWYDIDGVFDMHRVLDGWAGRLESALARGFSGLRLTGNFFWLEKKDWRSFLDYEAAVNDVIGKYRMIAICTYCLDKCDASEMMDVLSTHQFAVAKREGRWAAIEDSERKRLAEELRESEEQLRRLASFPELNPNPVTEMDLEGHIWYLNPAAKRLFPDLEVRGIEHPWLAGLLPIARQLAAGGEGPAVREVSVEGECYHQAAVYIEATRRLRLYGLEITGRKRAEEELRKLSRAVEQSPATVVITDLAGNIDYANPRFEETTGYSVAEAIGQNPRILKSGELPLEVYAEMWRTIMAGREWRGEFHNKKKNGELYWESASISPIRDGEGNITHFLAVKEDITERKKAEAERERLLEENQQRAAELDAVIQSIADPVVIYDLAGNVMLSNPAAHTLYGFDLAGLARQDILHKLTVRRSDGRPVTMDKMPSTLALHGETVRGRRFTISTPDGRDLVILASAAPLTAGENIFGAVVVWHDITERERLQEQQRRRAVELAAITESTQAHLALLDRDMNFVMVNSTYAQGSGHTEAELIGRNHFELFPNGENQAIFERVRNTGEPFQALEKPFEFADQPWRGVTYWDWTLTPVKDREGEVEGLVLSLFEVTPQVRARQRIELLASVAIGMNAGRSLDEVLRATFSATTKLLRADDYALFLFEEDGRHLSVSSELIEGRREGLVLDISECPNGQRAIDGGAAVYFTLPEAGGAETAQFKKLGMWGCLAAPLVADDRCLGLLVVSSSHQGYEPDPGDLALVDAIAGQCALAIDHFRAEAQVQAEQARLKSVLEQMPAGVIIAEAPSGKLTFANEHVARILRHPFVASQSIADEEGPRSVVASGFHLDGRPYAPEEWPLARTIHSGEVVVNEEIAVVRGDDSLGFILVSSGPIYDETGRVAAGVMAFHDVTERRYMEEKHSLILRTALDGFWITDTRANLLEVNEAYCNLTGYSRDELLAMNVSDLEANETPEDIERHIQKMMETGWDRFESRHRRKDGRTVDVEVGVNYSPGEGGRFFVFVRDIAERRAAEKRILELYSDLERRAHGLEALNKELEAFTYSVSHDLRTPLRAIDGFSQALLEDYNDRLDDTGKDYLQRVRHASQRMSELIDDLLTLSRLTRADMHLQHVDLSALAAEIAADLKRAEPERRVEFVITPGLVAQGDRRLLRVVMENLMENAWKFTSKHDSARIEFGLTERDDKAAFFVSDNGCGFDMAYAEKMFGAFQRLHRANEFSGTGIGLATVQRIINRHGGQVWAEGAVERGATIYFTL